MADYPTEPRRLGPLLMAWAVHVFTASGALFGLLAFHQMTRGDFHGALLWLFGSYLIDAVDGTLARAARVKEVLPQIDGRMLDYVIDFVNMVFVPAYFVYAFDFVPEPFRIWAVISILAASCYHYANSEALTPDYYFKGFPAMWSIVVFYLFFLGLEPVANGILIALFVVLHFVPIKFVYPTRTTKFRRLNLAFVLLCFACNLVLLITYPQRNELILGLSLGAVLSLLGVSLLATFQAGLPSLAKAGE